MLFALYGLVGLGVGAIIRATAGAITLLVVWPVMVEPIIGHSCPRPASSCRSTPGSQLTSTDNPQPQRGAHPVVPAGLVLPVFALVLLVVGAVLVSRRDA